MSLLVLAFPELSGKDYELIQQYRKDHDELYYPIVEPHFTIVFPVFDQAEDVFITEIKEKSRAIAPIDFSIRCATVNKDAFSEYSHTFLVPDEGFSNLVKLHDRLYSDLLFQYLRLDIDFLPHIGIGNSKDLYECKRMTDQWNKKDFVINGLISQLTIIDFSDGRIKPLIQISLTLG